MRSDPLNCIETQMPLRAEARRGFCRKTALFVYPKEAAHTIVCMKRFLQRAKVPLLSVALAAAVLFCAFAAYPALTAIGKNEPAAYEGILRLWHIDSFEGGKGSRASFLGGVAKEFEREHEGLFVLITVHTAQSAARAVAEGDVPDLLSFGCGASFAADIVRPLPFAGAPQAEIGGESCAVAWCRGAYFLFATEGDFSDVNAQNTVLSQGRGANVCGAAYLAGLRGDFAALPSVQAYLALMQGKYKYMLGTQRDVWRFETRAFPVQTKALSEYCDLMQYIAVCSTDAPSYAAAAEFVELLLSAEVQGRLTSVGMLAVAGDSLYGGTQSSLAEAEEEPPRYTVSPWLSDEAISLAYQSAAQALAGEENGAKNFKNILVQAL